MARAVCAPAATLGQRDLNAQPTPCLRSSAGFAGASYLLGGGFGRGAKPPSESFQPEEASRVALVDLRLVHVAGPHPLHGRDGVADEPRPLLGIEGEIGAEQHVIGAEEGEPALPGAPRPEERGVAVEHAEVVDGAELQPPEGAAVLGVVAPGAQLIEPAADAPLAE